MLVANYQQLARQDAANAGIDPNIFVRQIQQESGFNPAAHSGAGAVGIAQFMPTTAQGMGIDPTNPAQALAAAARYDAKLLHSFGGDYRLMLAGYNAGGGAARHALTAYPETRNYVARILGGANPPAAVPTAASPTAGGGMDPQRLAALQFVFKGSPIAGMLTQLPGLQAAPAAPAASTTAAVPGNLPKGVVNFMGKPVAAWIAPELAWARQHGWSGMVTSGYRSPAEQAALIGHSGGNPVAAPGHSNHQFTAYPGGAVDVSQAQQLAQILAGYPGGALLQYAGAQDPVHFSHPHNGGY